MKYVEDTLIRISKTVIELTLSHFVLIVEVNPKQKIVVVQNMPIQRDIRVYAYSYNFNFKDAKRALRISHSLREN